MEIWVNVNILFLHTNPKKIFNLQSTYTFSAKYENFLSLALSQAMCIFGISPEGETIYVSVVCMTEWGGGYGHPDMGTHGQTVTQISEQSERLGSLDVISNISHK